MAEGGVKLFIGGLSYSTDDASLRNAFEKFGDVLEARVVTDRETNRSRGFGFVTFAANSAAEEAIDKMSGEDLDGRVIRVDKAEPRKDGGGGGGRSGGRAPFRSGNSRSGPYDRSGGDRRGGRRDYSGGSYEDREDRRGGYRDRDRDGGRSSYRDRDSYDRDR